jgi:ferredoxin
VADKTKKIAASVPGRYYVDESCIGCAICSEIAPANFCMDHEEGIEYVGKQPTDLTEEHLCADAMDTCPADAIGDDSDL